ncbi:hypothetical protein [Hwanghaeella sp.]|uniref:hypothetical protein n=1 Tax=Hwanghaeella sp. TaxID=2605943 RepID=UPI003CCC17FA
MRAISRQSEQRFDALADEVHRAQTDAQEHSLREEAEDEHRRRRTLETGQSVSLEDVWIKLGVRAKKLGYSLFDCLI